MSTTVLVVEDDRSLQHTLLEVLEGDGYRAVTAGDTADGLRKLKACSPDILVLDLVLPHGDAFQFVEEMRRQGLEELPVLILTDYRFPRDYLKDLGVAALQYKPFDLDLFLEQIGQLAAGTGSAGG